MGSLFDTTRNFSLYTVPAAWVIALVPTVYARSVYSRFSSQPFPGDAPRTLLSKIADDSAIDARTRARITRAHGAHLNGLENLGLFAAAVVAGNLANMDSWWLNALSGGYLASRAVYNLLYVADDNGGGAGRGVVFFAGAGFIFALFIRAGNKLRDSVINAI